MEVPRAKRTGNETVIYGWGEGWAKSRNLKWRPSNGGGGRSGRGKKKVREEKRSVFPHPHGNAKIRTDGLDENACSERKGEKKIDGICGKRIGFRENRVDIGCTQPRA